MNCSRGRYQSGQSLIEMLFIIASTLLLLSGLVVAMVFMIKTATYARDKAIAIRLAEEKIEQIKASKQSADFWDNPDSYGCGDEETGLGENGIFYRNTTCANAETSATGGRNRIEVTTVSGWEGGDQSVVSVSIYLSNWEE